MLPNTHATSQISREIYVISQLSRGMHATSQVSPIYNKPSVKIHEEYMEYMKQTKCYTCNKSSVMTREEYMQHVKCQKEYMQQA